MYHLLPFVSIGFHIFTKPPNLLIEQLKKMNQNSNLQESFDSDQMFIQGDLISLNQVKISNSKHKQQFQHCDIQSPGLFSEIKLQKIENHSIEQKNGLVQEQNSFIEEDDELMRRWKEQKIVGMRASEKYKETLIPHDTLNNKKSHNVSKGMKHRGGRSIVWDIFQVSQVDDMNKCSICGAKYKRDALLTNTMLYHIKSQHKDEWEKSKRKKNSRRKQKPRLAIISQRDEQIDQKYSKMEIISEGILSFTPKFGTSIEQ